LFGQPFVGPLLLHKHNLDAVYVFFIFHKDFLSFYAKIRKPIYFSLFQ
jgi:hypothetical protein